MKTQIYALMSLSALLTINSRHLSAQGWIGNGGNILYARNSSLQLSPLNIGIGTNSPTAQFHTTGSVRFAGLTNSNQSRVLVSDASGNLYYRDASTLGGSNGWLLTGNSASTSNFIGTTNAQDFRIRTNNVQRMVITSAGNVGIGDAAPSSKLSISGNSSANEDRNYISLRNLSTDYASAVGISLSAGSDPSFSAGISHSASSYTVIPNFANVMHLYSNGGGIRISSTSSTGSVILNTNLDGSSHPIERMRITADGKVGIGTTAPTATFHTKGSVRFEGLSTGTGSALVVDANGNVHKSTTSLRTSDSENGELENLKKQVEALKNEIANLKAAVSFIQINGKTEIDAKEAKLFQNAPNPFSNATTISYFIPEGVQNAECIVYDLQGKEKRRIDLPQRGKGNLNIQGLPTGLYVYTLYVEGKFVDSKKMMIVK